MSVKVFLGHQLVLHTHTHTLDFSQLRLFLFGSPLVEAVIKSHLTRHGMGFGLLLRRATTHTHTPGHLTHNKWPQRITSDQKLCPTGTQLFACSTENHPMNRTASLWHRRYVPFRAWISVPSSTDVQISYLYSCSCLFQTVTANVNGNGNMASKSVGAAKHSAIRLSMSGARPHICEWTFGLLMRQFLSIEF